MQIPSLNQILLSGPTGIGELFANKDKAEGVLKTVQGVLTPRQQPINPTGDSFNFFDAFTNLFKPRPKETILLQAGQSVSEVGKSAVKAAGEILKTGIDAAKSVALSKIESSIRSGNQDNRPDNFFSQQPATIPAIALPTQIGSDLAQIIGNFFGKDAAIESLQKAIEPTKDLVTETANAVNRNVLIIAAIVGGVAILTLTKRGSHES